MVPAGLATLAQNAQQGAAQCGPAARLDTYHQNHPPECNCRRALGGESYRSKTA